MTDMDYVAHGFEPVHVALDVEDVVAVGDRQRHRRSVPAPNILSARAICEMQFDQIKFVVPGFIAEGCTLLAGTPKLGKSFLCLEIALAVAAGGTCMGGIQVPQGPVLYLALEDNRRRLQARIRKVWSLDYEIEAQIPEALDFSTTWPRADEGGIDLIRGWIANHPGALLVVIDVLAMFRAVNRSGRNEQQYEADYLAVKALQELASATGVAIIIVHHTRKGFGDVDPFDSISGTLGLSGAADTGMVLKRDSAGVVLYARGRDIEEIEAAVEFSKLTCRWKVLGNASEVRRRDERTVILEFLRDNPAPTKPAEIADALGLNRNNVKQLLFKMSKDAQVVKPRVGHYQHPDHLDNPSTHDNRDTR